MASDDVAELLERFDALKNGRREWEAHWDELAQVMLPRRAGFTSEPRPGAKQTEKIFGGVSK